MNRYLQVLGAQREVENKRIANIKTREELIEELKHQSMDNKRAFYGTYFYAFEANREEREEIQELVKKYSEYDKALSKFIYRDEIKNLS